MRELKHCRINSNKDDSSAHARQLSRQLLWGKCLNCPGHTQGDYGQGYWYSNCTCIDPFVSGAFSFIFIFSHTIEYSCVGWMYSILLVLSCIVFHLPYNVYFYIILPLRELLLHWSCSKCFSPFVSCSKCFSFVSYFRLKKCESWPYKPNKWFLRNMIQLKNFLWALDQSLLTLKYTLFIPKLLSCLLLAAFLVLICCL